MARLILYLRNLVVATNQLINALLGGDPDETISSRLGKGARDGCRVCRVVCWIIDRFTNDGHCARYIEEDRGRRQVWRWGRSGGPDG